MWRRVPSHVVTSMIGPTSLSPQRHLSNDITHINASLSEFGLPSIFFTNSELKCRYRELAQLHHPDCGGCEDKMSRVVVAYDILSNMSEKDKEQYAVQRRFYRGDQAFSDLRRWTRRHNNDKADNHSRHSEFSSNVHRQNSKSSGSETAIWLFGTTFVFLVFVVLTVRSAWSQAMQVHSKMVRREMTHPESRLLMLHQRRREVNDEIQTAKMAMLYGSWNQEREQSSTLMQQLLRERAILNEEIERCVVGRRGIKGRPVAVEASPSPSQ